jgi:hypothetical protein
VWANVWQRSMENVGKRWKVAVKRIVNMSHVCKSEMRKGNLTTRCRSMGAIVWLQVIAVDSVGATAWLQVVAVDSVGATGWLQVIAVASVGATVWLQVNAVDCPWVPLHGYR